MPAYILPNMFQYVNCFLAIIIQEKLLRVKLIIQIPVTVPGIVLDNKGYLLHIFVISI